MATGEIKGGRSVDRLINFFDAIVAVAITVLVRPIAGLNIDRGETTVWEVLGEHRGEIITFFFTSFVVSVLWLTHNRVMNELRGYDGIIFWLTVMARRNCLSSRHQSPVRRYRSGWVSAVGDLYGSGMLYWGSMALISLITKLIARHARRIPVLYVCEQAAKGAGRTKYRGWIYVTYFLSIGVISLFSPTISSYMPIGFFFLPLLTKNKSAATSVETSQADNGHYVKYVQIEFRAMATQKVPARIQPASKDFVRIIGFAGSNSGLGERN